MKVKITQVKPNPKNPRVITDVNFERLVQSIKDFPEMLEKRPLVCFTDVDKKFVVLGGNKRLKAVIETGLKEIPITLADDWTEEQKRQFVIKDNLSYGEWDWQALRNDFIAEELEEWGLELPDYSINVFTQEHDSTNGASVIAQAQNPSLFDRFIIPPFSVFDTRQGYWQERKKWWHTLFNSQESREEVELIAISGQAPAIYHLRNQMRDGLGREPSWDEIIDAAKTKGLHLYEGASVFDPVLTEIIYTWFIPDGGTILDPFAGGSVRGVISGFTGHRYTGIDLRPEQVNANIKQADDLEIENVFWISGNSLNLEELLPKNEMFDFIFSCPPYFDLEKYSEDPADLSNMTYGEFLKAYCEIIRLSLNRLKQNRFACFVVGEIRDDKGFYRNFVGDTVKAFRDAGAEFYNEIILLNVAGSLPVRVGRQFEAGRKVGKTHQNVLVFFKGDPKKIKEEFPKINITEYLQELNYQPNIALSFVDS